MAKRTTTTTQNRTGTVTPNVPDWISQPAQSIAGGVNSIVQGGSDPYKPVITDSQRDVWGDAANLAGANYGEANDMLRGGTVMGGYDPYSAANVEAQSLLTGLEGYYNPFKDQVLNPVLDDYDQQSGITRAAQAANAAMNKAFQGSRYGIQEGQTEGELARGRAATEGGLLKDMYSEATQLSNLDAGRRQDASAANAAAANAASQFNANMQFQMDQANQQAELARAQQLASNIGAGDASAQQALKLRGDAAAQEAGALTAQNQYPLEFLKQAGGLLEGINPSQFIGQTMNDTMTGTNVTKEKQGIGDWFGNALTAFAGGAGKAAAFA